MVAKTTFKVEIVFVKDVPKTKTCILYHMTFSVQSYILEVCAKLYKKLHPLLTKTNILSKKNIVKSQIPEVKAKHVNKAIPVTD